MSVSQEEEDDVGSDTVRTLSFKWAWQSIHFRSGGNCRIMTFLSDCKFKSSCVGV